MPKSTKPLLPPNYELKMVTPIGDTEPSLWLIEDGGLSTGGMPEEDLIRAAWSQFRSSMTNERLHKLIEEAGGWSGW